MSNGQRFNLEKIERGRDASLMGGIVKPYIDEKVTIQIRRLVQLYRGGQYTHDMLVGGIAHIAGLLMLLEDLEAIYRQGVVASEKEFGDGRAEERG